MTKIEFFSKIWPKSKFSEKSNFLENFDQNQILVESWTKIEICKICKKNRLFLKILTQIDFFRKNLP